MDDLLNFVKAARSAEQGAPPNFNTMVGRKMSFGSIAGVLKGVLPVGAAISGASVFGPGVGVGGTLGLILMGWKGSEIMSNPAYLRDATTFLSKTSGETERRMAFIRVAQAVLPNKSGYYASPTGGATGKTPPATIMERAYGGLDKASNFLLNFVPQ